MFMFTQHINKIKFGYSQNPESYQLIQQIYRDKEAQKMSFILKL